MEENGHTDISNNFPTKHFIIIFNNIRSNGDEWLDGMNMNDGVGESCENVVVHRITLLTH
jgi:hypothetical protein